MTTEVIASAEPGDMTKGQMLRGASAIGHEMSVASMEDGQWFWVYSTVDGTPSRLNINMRDHIDPHSPRAWRNADGQLSFTRDKPTFPYPISGGSIMCLLHPKNPIREHLNTIGLAGRFCIMGNAERGKENIVSDMDLQLHMQKCHKGEFAIINSNRTSIERAQDRAIQARSAEVQEHTAKSMLAIANRLEGNVNDNGDQSGSDNDGDTGVDGFASRGPGRPRKI